MTGQTNPEQVELDEIRDLFAEKVAEMAAARAWRDSRRDGRATARRSRNTFFTSSGVPPPHAEWYV